MTDDNTYRNLGNLSAVDPAYSKQMYCDNCIVTWIGCWKGYGIPRNHESFLVKVDGRGRGLYWPRVKDVERESNI